MLIGSGFGQLLDSRLCIGAAGHHYAYVCDSGWRLLIIVQAASNALENEFSSRKSTTFRLLKVYICPGC